MGIPKRVVICTDAHWGSVTEKEYAESAQSLRQLIERWDAKTDNKTEKLASVDIVYNLEEVKKILCERPINDTVDVLIFLSRGAIAKAREIKKAYSRLRVVVLTGLVPEDEVVVVGKAWVTPEFLKNLIRFA